MGSAGISLCVGKLASTHEMFFGVISAWMSVSHEGIMGLWYHSNQPTVFMMM